MVLVAFAENGKAGLVDVLGMRESTPSCD